MIAGAVPQLDNCDQRMTTCLYSFTDLLLEVGYLWVTNLFLLPLSVSVCLPYVGWGGIGMLAAVFVVLLVPTLLAVNGYAVAYFRQGRVEGKDVPCGALFCVVFAAM